MTVTPTEETTAVFVDASGRRASRLAWAIRAVTALVALYIALLIASFARAPFVPKVGLPSIGIPSVGPVAPPSLGPGAVASPQPTVPSTTLGPTSTTTQVLSTAKTAPPAPFTEGQNPVTSATTPGVTNPGSGTPPTSVGTTPSSTSVGSTTTAPGNSGNRGRPSTTTTNPRRP